MADQIINVAFSIDKNLQDKIWTCYNSIVKNTKSKIQFFIFTYKDVSESFKNRYRDMGIIVLEDDLGLDIRFDNIDFVSSMAIYSRFMIPKLDIDKCIYVEPDSVYDCDIKDHWDIDLENNVLGCVRDWFSKTCIQLQRWSGVVRGIDLNIPAYLTGNMLINCVEWRKMFITKKLIDFVKENRTRVNLTMSYMFKDRIKELGYEWCFPANYKDRNTCRHPGIEYMDIDKAKIYHWSGKNNKPWQVKCFNQDIWDKYA